MADVSKLRLDGTTYDVKDENARKYLVMVDEQPQPATKVVIETIEGEYELAFQADVDALKKNIGEISVSDFGAIGNGVADDSDAFIAANASTEPGYISVPPGRYSIKNVTVTKSLLMKPGAVLLYNNDIGGTMLTINANNQEYEIYVDCENKHPLNVIAVTGNGNHFRTIDVRNVAYTGTQSANRCVYVIGNNNTFDFVRGENLYQDAAGNDSCPQLIALSGVATRNHFASIYGYSIRAGLVDAAGPGTVNSAGTISVYECHDNAIYHVRGGHLDATSVEYDGDNECVCVIDDEHTELSQKTTCNIGTIKSKSCFHALRIHDAQWVNVGSIEVGHCDHVFVVQAQNVESGDIHIGNISVTKHTIRPIYCPSGRGIVRSLSIDNISIVDDWTDETASGPSGYMDFSVCQSIAIGAYDLKIIGVADTFYHHIPSLSYRSWIGKVHNKSDPANVVTIRFRGVAQENLDFENGYYRYDQSTLDLDIGNQDNYEDGCWTRLAPTTGYWKAGKLFKSTHEDHKGEFLICTESGSPGTWKYYHPFDSPESVRYHNGHLQYYNGTTWVNT